jgi:hypothetical protein
MDRNASYFRRESRLRLDGQPPSIQMKVRQGKEKPVRIVDPAAIRNKLFAMRR